jgi:hypothetical protein
MRLVREHAHDLELLARMGGVHDKDGRTLLMRTVARRDVARAAEIVAACSTPASRERLLAAGDSRGATALPVACSSTRKAEDIEATQEVDEDAALAVVELLLGAGADPFAANKPSGARQDQPIHCAARCRCALCSAWWTATCGLERGCDGGGLGAVRLPARQWLRPGACNPTARWSALSLAALGGLCAGGGVLV